MPSREVLPVRCKTTCGLRWLHVDAVRRGVPAADWCPGYQSELALR